MAKHKKTAEILVRSLEDVVDLVNRNVDIFDFRIGKLAKKCKSAKLLSLIAVGCAVYSAMETKKQEEELYKLSLRVKKLENKEEE